MLDTLDDIMLRFKSILQCQSMFLRCLCLLKYGQMECLSREAWWLISVTSLYTYSTSQEIGWEQHLQWVLHK